MELALEVYRNKLHRKRQLVKEGTLCQSKEPPEEARRAWRYRGPGAAEAGFKVGEQATEECRPQRCQPHSCQARNRRGVRQTHV